MVGGREHITLGLPKAGGENYESRLPALLQEQQTLQSLLANFEFFKPVAAVVVFSYASFALLTEENPNLSQARSLTDSHRAYLVLKRRNPKLHSSQSFPRTHLDRHLRIKQNHSTIILWAR